MTLPDWTTPARPYAIAHRGASAYAPDCSLEAYALAARLGADLWEVDIRSALCGTLITYHDASLPDGRAIADLTAAQIAEAAAAQNVPAVPFAEVVALAIELGAGIYADIKDTAASLPTMRLLQEAGIDRAILGAFDPEAARLLREAHCPYPTSALVPVGADPFEHAQHADIIHLCWERMERPQDLLDDAFFATCEARGQKVVLWHEEDPDRMAVLRELPVLGICSDRPELVHPWHAPEGWDLQIVCHRGASEFAPENTLHAMHCAFAGGFDVVEFDVHCSADGEPVIFHDQGLNRTSNGRGALTWASYDHLRSLDAGAWFAPQFAGTRIPHLDEALALGQSYGGGFYVELKTADPAVVLASVRAQGMLERCFFWSFDHALVARLRAEEPRARLMVRRGDCADVAATLAQDPWVVEFGPNEDPSEMQAIRAAGAKVMIAYMGHDPQVFDRIIDLRPDMVNLHFPYRFRDLLAGRTL